MLLLPWYIWEYNYSSSVTILSVARFILFSSLSLISQVVKSVRRHGGGNCLWENLVAIQQVGTTAVALKCKTQQRIAKYEVKSEIRTLPKLERVSTLPLCFLICYYVLHFRATVTNISHSTFWVELKCIHKVHKYIKEFIHSKAYAVWIGRVHIKHPRRAV